MGMLDRIKRKQNEGFKEFVTSMETTASATKTQIFLTGVLEDPIFMSYVMKNLRTFDDLLKLEGDDLDTLLTSQDQLLNLFAKALSGSPQELIMGLESSIPRLMSQLKDELSYLAEISTQEKNGARIYLLKTVRKLQQEDRINGFRWNLPPQNVYYPRPIKDGVAQIFFEDGTIAATGLHMKGQRVGEWKHFYETGKLLAEGDYFDGQKTGFWKFYYGNGSLKSEGEYRFDERHGTWEDYDRDGVVTIVEYVDGVKKTS